MKAIVYPHDLDMGGSQMNAIEIAAAVRDLGVETTVFGRRGTLNERIDELGLDFVEAPPSRRRPSPAVVTALRDAAAHRGATVLHGYEWPPALECYVASVGRRAAVGVCTVMSMAVAPFLPRGMPLLVGTEQIADAERIVGRTDVGVLEPPVDLAHNAAVAEEAVAAFRRQHGVDAHDFLLVCVSRLAQELKAEGILSAISAVAGFPAGWRTRLVVVGDGPAREEIEVAAAAANTRADRPVVILAGQITDPRAAYAAADAVLGMGGSALRALAYAKPLIVQGEQGFFSLLDEGSAPTFFWQGWYGVGEGPTDGPAAFTEIVRRLVLDPELRRRLGAFGRRLVVDRFSLQAAARRQIEFYERAVLDKPSTSQLLAGGGVALAPYALYQGDRKLRRALGRGAADDFNNKPVAATRALPVTVGPEPAESRGGPSARS